MVLFSNENISFLLDSWKKEIEIIKFKNIKLKQ